MEDRRTPVLHLEPSDWAADRWKKERAPELAALPGAHRVTWWENVVPDRDDLPRQLPEFPLLGLVEGDDELAANAPDAGFTFRTTSRPAQGCLTAEPTDGLSVVLISPATEKGAAALRDWADLVHIRHIAACVVPGFGMITPYENVRGAGRTPRWLHLYEISSPDPERAFKAMTPLVSRRLGGRGSDAFRDWAWHPELVIEYVNTFRLLGERRAVA